MVKDKLFEAWKEMQKSLMDIYSGHLTFFADRIILPRSAFSGIPITFQQLLLFQPSQLEAWKEMQKSLMDIYSGE
jgi:hypothetical protein